MMKVRSVLDGFASGIFGGTCEHDDDDASKRVEKLGHPSSKNKARSQVPVCKFGSITHVQSCTRGQCYTGTHDKTSGHLLVQWLFKTKLLARNIRTFKSPYLLVIYLIL